MKQEYLFLKEKQKNDVKNLEFKNVSYEIKNFGKNGAFIVVFSVKSNTKNDAVVLSEIDETIMKAFHPITITNEASAYFNKSLYPFFNEFERSLRKVVYLACTYNNVELESVDNVLQKLEEYDFGEIYKILFTDDNFTNEVRRKFGKNNDYSKKDMLLVLKDMSEKTLWEEIVGIKELCCVPENFLTVKGYRNDTMHAHNIHYAEYVQARELLTYINQEMNQEINHYLNNDFESKPSEVIASALESLSRAMEAVRKPLDLSKMMEGLISFIESNLENDQSVEQESEEENGQVKDENE